MSNDEARMTEPDILVLSTLGLWAGRLLESICKLFEGGSTGLGFFELSVDVFLDHELSQVWDHFPGDALDDFPAQLLYNTVGNTFDEFFGNHSGKMGWF